MVKPAKPRRSANEATTKGPYRIAHKQKASGKSITPLGNEPSPLSPTTTLLRRPETRIPFGPPRTFLSIRVLVVKAKRRRQADRTLSRPAASCSKLLPAVRQLPAAVRVLFPTRGEAATRSSPNLSVTATCAANTSGSGCNSSIQAVSRADDDIVGGGTDGNHFSPAFGNDKKGRRDGDRKKK
ncbi:hypothetical protein MTO96_016172 [Rhipicephalus appendiculatus]